MDRHPLDGARAKIERGREHNESLHTEFTAFLKSVFVQMVRFCNNLFYLF